MNEIEKFRKRAYKEGLCDDYRKMWKHCSSPQQYVDMALGVRAMDYLCDAYAKGWGVSADFWSNNIQMFINGNYVSQQNGYTSKAYVSFKGEANADTTAIMVIDSDIELNAKDTDICQMFVSGKCRLELKGKGRVIVYCYGNPQDIQIVGENTNYKRINKSRRDD